MINIYNVYTLFDIEPVRAQGVYVYDSDDTEYLDFYGGHAVISIGHSHPYFVRRIQDQVEEMVFYSNSVKNSLQQFFCSELEKASDLHKYDLFFCNSGAEANENALKLASFHNQRTKILSLRNGFHGRTSAAVNATDNRKITAPINKGFEVKFHDIGRMGRMYEDIKTENYCAVIIEAVQGIGGIHEVPDKCLKKIKHICNETDTVLIMDEIQCGYGRTGDFFAYQRSGIRPDIITMAKGMGNGFPIGGVLINSVKIPAWKGMLGSTFGGNQLACAAGAAVLEVIQQEKLISNAQHMGDILKSQLDSIEDIKEIRGRGLMLGIDFGLPISDLRKDLLYTNKIFTGSSSDKNVMRLLPPLCINEDHISRFIEGLKNSIDTIKNKN